MNIVFLDNMSLFPMYRACVNHKALNERNVYDFQNVTYQLWSIVVSVMEKARRQIGGRSNVLRLTVASASSKYFTIVPFTNGDLSLLVSPLQLIYAFSDSNELDENMLMNQSLQVTYTFRRLKAFYLAIRETHPQVHSAALLLSRHAYTIYNTLHRERIGSIELVMGPSYKITNQQIKALSMNGAITLLIAFYDLLPALHKALTEISNTPQGELITILRSIP